MLMRCFSGMDTWMGPHEMLYFISVMAMKKKRVAAFLVYVRKIKKVTIAAF